MSAAGSDAAAAVLEVVVGLIVDAQGRVLVNQRRPGTPLAGFWEFPGGKRRPDESPREALARELLEELGVRVLDARPLIEVRHDYPERRVRLDVWVVSAFEGRPEPRENQPLAWLAPGDLEGLPLLPADRPIVEALRSLGS